MWKTVKYTFTHILGGVMEFRCSSTAWLFMNDPEQTQAKEIVFYSKTRGLRMLHVRLCGWARLLIWERICPMPKGHLNLP